MPAIWPTERSSENLTINAFLRFVLVSLSGKNSCNQSMFSFLLKLLPLFLLSMVKFVVGVPSAKVAFDLNFIELLLFSTTSGIAGVATFLFLGKWIFKGWDILRARFFPPKQHRKKKKFSRNSRIMVKIIRKYGLPGIAFITPTIISIPVGTMLAEALYKHQPRMVFLYLSGSVILWALIFSAALSFL